MTLPAGTLLGSFEVIGLLGAGGMGEVYRAKDQRLGREVAVKVLAADFLAAPEHLRRFIGEARAASTLNHRNIITIFEVGQADGQPFLAMELVEGQTLRHLAAAGLLPLRKALDVMVQVAEGLAAAHEASLVHRDLKPENVMVARGRGAERLGKAEVEDLHGAVAGNHDVLGLEVAVDEARGVGRGEPFRDLADQLERLPDREEAARGDLSERLAVDELHGEKRLAGGLPDLEDRDDVPVVQRRRRARLADEPAKVLGVREEVGPEDLHGDLAAEPLVARPVDLAHASGAEERKHLE